MYRPLFIGLSSCKYPTYMGLFSYIKKKSRYICVRLFPHTCTCRRDVSAPAARRHLMAPLLAQKKKISKISSRHILPVYKQHNWHMRICAKRGFVQWKNLCKWETLRRRRAFFMGPWFWKYFQNDSNFEGKKSFSRNVGQIQVFSPYGGKSFGLGKTKEISKIPRFLGGFKWGLYLSWFFFEKSCSNLVNQYFYLWEKY